MKKVLWTGGWDSTYRVLDLVLNKKIEVQPYYVLDHGRKSAQVEIETMNKIKKMMIKMDPSAINLIKDPIFIEERKIPNNDDIRNDYLHLLSQSYLGSQYVYLASYIDHMKLKVLELCIHTDDKAESFIKNDVELIDDGKDSYYKLVESPSIPQLRIFSYFTYPLLKMTKLEMADKARESGFDHIMEETWFCYNPLKDGKPCGVCNPCKYTKEEGLGRRIPNATLYRRFQVFMLKAKHRLKNM